MFLAGWSRRASHRDAASALNRILVIGSGGSGKTTVARRLAERTGLPLIHLDALYWRPGWNATPAEEWRNIVRQLIARDAWIIDGNYGGTLDARRRPAILRRLEGLRGRKRVVILRSQREVE